MLLDKIKNYINEKIAEDTELNVSIGVREQYPYGHKPNPPEILLSVMDDVEMETATTFDGETVSNISLQIIPVANSMNIGGKKHNAQNSCTILGDKIAMWFEKNAIKQILPEIINTRRVQKSNSIPYENGTTAYYAILRFSLMVNK